MRGSPYGHFVPSWDSMINILYCRAAISECTRLTAAHLFLMKHCLTDPAQQDIPGHPVQHKQKILMRVWSMYSM